MADTKDPTAPPTRPAWLGRVGHHWKALVVAALVTSCSVWLLNAGALPMLPTKESLTRPSPMGLAGFILLTVLALAVRAGRFHYLMSARERPPLAGLFAINFGFFGLNIVLPMRLGELSRPLMLARHGGISTVKALALSVAERIVDGVVGSSLLVFGLLASTLQEPLPRKLGELRVNAALVPAAAYASALLFGAALLGALLFARQRELAGRILARASRPLGAQLVSKLAQVLESLGEGLSVLGQRSRLAPFLALTVSFWLCNALGIWWLARLYGIEQVGPAEATVILGIIALGLMLPSAPGFFGAFQVAGYVGLALFLPAGEVASRGEGLVFWVYTVHVGAPLVLAAASSPCLMGGRQGPTVAAALPGPRDSPRMVDSGPSP